MGVDRASRERVAHCTAVIGMLCGHDTPFDESVPHKALPSHRDGRAFTTAAPSG